MIRKRPSEPQSLMTSARFLGLTIVMMATLLKTNMIPNKKTNKISTLMSKKMILLMKTTKIFTAKLLGSTSRISALSLNRLESRS